MARDDSTHLGGALFSVAAFLALFSASLFLLDGGDVSGIAYLRPEVLQPIFPVLRAAGAFVALLGLWLWIGGARETTSRIALIAGGSVFLLLAVPASYSPWRFWPAVFFPWLMLALGRGMFVRLAVAALWIFCDSSGVFLPLFFGVIAVSELASGERSRARESGLVALGALVLAPLHWSFIVSSAEALSRGASVQLAVLGWQGPKFQDEPQLVAAIVLFLGGLALAGGARREERAALLSVFLLALFQRRLAGMMIECSAWAVALGVDRVVSARSACTRVEFAEIRRTALYGALGGLALLFVRTPARLSGSAEDEVITALKRYEGSLHGQKTQLRLFHELTFGELLRHFELNTFVEPDWSEAALSRTKPRDHAGAFADYRALIALNESWTEIFARQKFNAALINRAQPLAGVLIEREKWSVLAAGGRDGMTLLLVPPFLAPKNLPNQLDS